jgi:hypothetical protein
MKFIVNKKINLHTDYDDKTVENGTTKFLGSQFITAYIEKKKKNILFQI